MATWRDLITAALVELNIPAAGETPDTADMTLGYAVLGRMVNQWAAERLTIYQITRTTWAIVSNQSEYTVGPTGNVNIVRPVYIEHVRFQDTSTSPVTEYPLTPLTDDAWAAVPQKTLTSSLPTTFYWNPTYALATLTLWPVPTSSTLQGVLYYAEAVAAPTGLSSVVALPPGYEEMIVTNLAVKMSTSYGRQIDGTLFGRAQEAKEIVKRANTRLMDLSFDRSSLVQGAGGRYWWSIITGP